MIAFRANDGRTGNPLFSEGTLRGEWRALAVGGNNFQWMGEVRPFLIPGPEMFRTRGPLDLESAKYAAEFNRVKALGRATESTRTQNQTDAALFWNENAVAMWTRIARQLSAGEGLNAVENARYFAMLYTTGADALIACFDDKERWHFWRPTTAIQLAGGDGNPDTVADPAWTSLLPVPPYPDHPSGHNCFSGSIVRTLQQFYGTNQMSFSATNTLAEPAHHPQLLPLLPGDPRDPPGQDLGWPALLDARCARCPVGAAGRELPAGALLPAGVGAPLKREDAPEQGHPPDPSFTGRRSGPGRRWGGAGSNRRHRGFQPRALPTELPPPISPRGSARP